MTNRLIDPVLREFDNWIVFAQLAGVSSAVVASFRDIPAERD
jgi:hypothetical protein